MVKSTERVYFSERRFNTTKLRLIRLSVYDSVLNVNERNNPFLYASVVLDNGVSSPSKSSKINTKTLINSAVIPGA